MEGAELKIRRKMELRGIPEDAIQDFLDKVARAHSGGAYVPLEELSTPDVGRVLDLSSDSRQIAELHERGRSLLDRVAIVKLNGGRNTTMGGKVPKGILRAKTGRSYLEIIIGQVRAVREQFHADIPLILMNSFFTHGPTVEIVSRCGLPVLMFVQGQVPRLIEASLEPLDTGTEEDWVPPGHGDVYVSLLRTGLLQQLRERGCRWAFISNLDNLAAYLDPWILGAIAEYNVDFLLEVTDRTSADRKGGTLVMRDGRIDLLEIAQVAPEQRNAFMDIERFKVFNTNNVWVDLDALWEALMDKTLRLPLIQNHKLVGGSTVIQLETAMGAAIGSFPRARGLRVGRDRFFPTKQVADLFVLQSDACVLDAMNRLQRSPQRPSSLPFMPSVAFAPDFLASPDDMFTRFEDPSSVSLVAAESLEVSGPVFFERGVRIEGKVVIDAARGKHCRIPAGTVLRNETCP
jgi:UTP--glucose-1-phosphate uridylyltransferase